ncbi:hypothetical protein B0J14DRAFT_557407 [Halenospora varia]|nr:hypothetical protein B0J14DRAFT_557407 [Halenospora varia]
MPCMVARRGPRTKWYWSRGKQPIKFGKGFHFVIGFKSDTSVPGWWREESLYTTISYCALYLHSWLKSNQREQDKHSQAIKVGTDMYLDLLNFPCPPGAGPPPNENKKWPLHLYCLVIARKADIVLADLDSSTSSSEEKVIISLPDILLSPPTQPGQPDANAAKVPKDKKPHFFRASNLSRATFWDLLMEHLQFYSEAEKLKKTEHPSDEED